jgi:hypothetical protein
MTDKQYIMPPQLFDLCTQRDEFIWDKPVWIAELSNGIEIWQDDGREGLWEHSAWIRLGKYIQSTGLKIKKLTIRFRSHIITIPKGRAYYFTRGLLGKMGSKTQQHFFCVGHLNEDDVFVVLWYKVPELVVTRTVERPKKKIRGQESIEGVG